MARILTASNASDEVTTLPQPNGDVLVQAWEWRLPGMFGGYVYTMVDVLNRMEQGCDAEAVTIIRHANGGRTYLPGVLAHCHDQYLRTAPKGAPS